MDNPAVAPEIWSAFHADLTRLNRLLGNDRLLLDWLRLDPPKSVLDIGCGEGALLARLRDHLHVPVRGVDLRPPLGCTCKIEIITADATRDPLPSSDLAICVVMVHHLDEAQVIALVRNVGRFCARMLIVDLVRHPLPLLMFSVFLRPLVGGLVFVDGLQSIRRAYQPDELRSLVVRGLQGTRSVFAHWVSPIYSKQVIDIRYRA